MDSSSPHTIQPRSCCLRFPLFGALKGAILGKRFGSEDEALEELAAAQNSNWYKKRIDALVCR